MSFILLSTNMGQCCQACPNDTENDSSALVRQASPVDRRYMLREVLISAIVVRLYGAHTDICHICGRQHGALHRLFWISIARGCNMSELVMMIADDSDGQIGHAVAARINLPCQWALVRVVYACDESSQIRVEFAVCGGRHAPHQTLASRHS